MHMDMNMGMDMKRFLCPEPDEGPLDRLIPTGGMTAIFRRIGCIGDSLSSGELEVHDTQGRVIWLDLLEHSWGQYLARMTGAEVFNFSRGGMTAQEYCESFADSHNFWAPKLACDAYILALGVNDLYAKGQELGSVADIDMENCERNRSTFAGCFGKIIQRLRCVQPGAKLFFVPIPRRQAGEASARRDGHAALMYDLAEAFGNAYVIDLRRYGPLHDEGYRVRFYGASHLNTMGYYLTALQIGSYIDWIIRHNPADFRANGLAGLPYTLAGS